ncbi:MAG: hypothetical protein ABSA48_00745 [Terracidiphilus sp.]|jgi:hypothetical protein
MHFNFGFTAVQILWTLTFAALLVLLVVLLGRDRARRFPWFTASIVLLTLRLLSSRLLYGKLPPLTLNTIFITLADVMALVGLLVLVEMARRAFSGAQRSIWIVNTLGMLALAGGVVAVWGPWPAWKTLTASSQLAVLELMQLAAQKANLLLEVLTVELGLLVVVFGRRFKAGWRSHTQQIVIGLSTAAIAHLAMQGTWQLIALKAVPHTQAEYERILGLRDKLSNANGSVYVAVLLWWIVCLWIDEPGTEVAGEAPAEIPAAAGTVETAEEPAGAHMEEEEEEQKSEL